MRRNKTRFPLGAWFDHSSTCAKFWNRSTSWHFVIIPRKLKAKNLERHPVSGKGINNVFDSLFWGLHRSKQCVELFSCNFVLFCVPKSFHFLLQHKFLFASTLVLVK